MSTQLSGLVSGFDWKSFVDTMMDLEREPIRRMSREQTTNLVESNALLTLDTGLKDLRSAVDALAAPDVFATRQATISGAAKDDWSATVEAGTPTGSHSFELVAPATAARIQGATDLGSSLAATADVSGVSLANFGTSINPTAGFFTVNGAQVTVDLGESLSDLFDRISGATGGEVTASYNPSTDGIELSSANSISLGAANDTTNFLALARLHNNGTGSITSAAALGALNQTAGLDNARLATAITATDGNGDGTFSINGVEISYNVTTDALVDVMDRINQSAAGVRASYDSVADRMVLTNAVTGDLGISIDEASGGLLGALGLTGGATFAAGDNARFTINGGSEITSTRNNLTEAEHGIAGLTIVAQTVGTGTVEVSANDTDMRSTIDRFISAFNTVQRFIDNESKISSSNGEVSASTLSDNREVQNWAIDLRRQVFASVPGLETGIARLESLGIDFTSGTSELRVVDANKLDDAIANRADDVAAFFQQGSDGFTARLSTLLDGYLGVNGGTGQLEAQRTRLNDQNSDLDQQIADIERRLVQRREILESSFIAMETAQSKLNQMQDQLARAFPATSNSTTK
jgi:flagellar hook-associated protein 2